MKITYIHHSSFLVEMDQAAFLFDYFEGQLPEILDKPLVIFPVIAMEIISLR